MSVVNTLGAALFQEFNLVGSGLDTPGLPAPLGFKTKLAASENDIVLCYLVTATGAVAGGPDFYRTQAYRNAAAGTYTAYTVPANTGDQEWILVYNDSGSIIQKGTPVKYKAGTSYGPFSVTPMGASDHPHEYIGTAQFDIAVGKAAFVCCGGWFQGTPTASAIGDGEAVDIASGAFQQAAAVSDPVVAKAYGATGTSAASANLIHL